MKLSKKAQSTVLGEMVMLVVAISIATVVSISLYSAATSYAEREQHATVAVFTDVHEWLEQGQPKKELRVVVVHTGGDAVKLRGTIALNGSEPLPYNGTHYTVEGDEEQLAGSGSFELSKPFRHGEVLKLWVDCTEKSGEVEIVLSSETKVLAKVEEEL